MPQKRQKIDAIEEMLWFLHPRKRRILPHLKGQRITQIIQIEPFLYIFFQDKFWVQNFNDRNDKQFFVQTVKSFLDQMSNCQQLISSFYELRQNRGGSLLL
jgi:hypothetical protein